MNFETMNLETVELNVTNLGSGIGDSDIDPSLLVVTSMSREEVFAQLPDVIQEAIISTEFSTPQLRISRIQNSQLVDTQDFVIPSPSPTLFTARRLDSGISLPDLSLTDAALLSKYGSDLTANFADIRSHGAGAFFQSHNASDNTTYSLCTCATGYIWVSTSLQYEARFPREFSDVDVRIGTFALAARAVTIAVVPCRYKISYDEDLRDGRLALLCSSVLATYLKLRMVGRQCEDAAEMAMREARAKLAAHRVVDPGKFGCMTTLLRGVCENAPMMPVSDVSMISRRMVLGRWSGWSRGRRLRGRWRMPERVWRSWKGEEKDAVRLLSGCFKV